MSGTLSATTLASIAPYLTAATQIANLGSTGYNLYNSYENQKYQNTLREDAQNPAKVTALAQQYTQPLNAGLVAGVNNQTQAKLAESGLSESPQISQQVEAQAIAPYIQQNQQQGYNDAIEALGLGGGAIPPAQQQQANLSALAKAFSQLSPAGKGIDPAVFAQLMSSGAVQPATIDDSNSTYVPDYSSQINPPAAPDYSASLANGGYLGS